jgi:phosphorylcholine metabolism protein LicD
MKFKTIFAFLLLCILFSTNSFAQNSLLKIKAIAPNKLKLGQTFILKTTVAHNYNIEKTGGLTCTLLNAKTHVPVDGWFINIFPFQYFTTILNTPFETEFSFTVPNDYKGNFEINLVANVDQIKDSIHFLIPTYK